MISGKNIRYVFYKKNCYSFISIVINKDLIQFLNPNILTSKSCIFTIIHGHFYVLCVLSVYIIAVMKLRNFVCCTVHHIHFMQCCETGSSQLMFVFVIFSLNGAVI